jgi:hypothetical protein
VPYRRIASQYGVGEKAVERHKDHISQVVKKAKEHAEIAHADKLLDKLKGLQIFTQEILLEAVDGKAKDSYLALNAIGRLEKQIELEAKLTGAFDKAKPDSDDESLSQLTSEQRRARIHELKAKVGKTG